MTWRAFNVVAHRGVRATASSCTRAEWKRGAARAARAHAFYLDLVSLGLRDGAWLWQAPRRFQEGEAGCFASDLVPVDENDVALACTQADEKPTITQKLADAKRELASAKTNARTAATASKTLMALQKKQAAIDVSELKGRNKTLTDMIRLLKR